MTIQDPRERPTDKQQLAAEKHARFRDENSDFTGFLNLWGNYLQEKQQELYVHPVPPPVPDGVHQLLARQGMAGPVRPAPSAGPAARHRPGQQALGRPRGQPRRASISVCSRGCSATSASSTTASASTSARGGSRFAIFPGSALFKKSPTFVMAAELVGAAVSGHGWRQSSIPFGPRSTAWRRTSSSVLTANRTGPPRWAR